MTGLERHHAAVDARLRAAGITPAGPGSVTWTINREIVVVAGWGRAVLLQLAHPSIAQGLHDHSSFRGGLRAGVSRLRSTVGAMLAISFGDAKARIAAAARINATHDRVRGRTYSAHDPQMQRWVHATLVDSTLRLYERLIAPLTPLERDQYCRDATIMEPLLGMPSGWLPRDAAQLDTAMRETLDGGRLAVTETSRTLARALLYPSGWRLAWPVFRAVQVITIGTLPASIRDAYGFAWTPRDDRALARWSAVLRRALRGLPPVARHWPMARMMGQWSPDAKLSPRSQPPRRCHS